MNTALRIIVIFVAVLVCITSAAAWARSGSGPYGGIMREGFALQTGWGEWYVQSEVWRLELGLSVPPNPPTHLFSYQTDVVGSRPGATPTQVYKEYKLPLALFRFAGIYYIQEGSTYHALSFPDWMIIAGSGSIAIWQGCCLFRRNRAYASALCGTCGYDLRASKEKCPECGTPIPPLTLRGML